MTDKDNTGKKLELFVADVYRKLGARKVEHNVELAGNQIDVYVELETPDGLVHRIAVEAKDWTDPVGIGIVNHFAQIVDLLRGKRIVDQGVIVSAAGFSRPGRNAAKEYGIHLLEEADLHAMVKALDYFEMLNEWKKLHNLLQELLITFRPFHREVDLAYAGRGVLNSLALERLWHHCDIQIEKLIEFAQNIDFIGERYEAGPEGLSGEPWVVITISQQQRIKAALKEECDSQILNDLANDFDSKCFVYLDNADKALYEIASDYIQPERLM